MMIPSRDILGRIETITENGMLIGILGIGIVEVILLAILAVIVGGVIYIFIGSGRGDE